jgi:hypothetical protein
MENPHNVEILEPASFGVCTEEAIGDDLTG